MAGALTSTISVAAPGCSVTLRAECLLALTSMFFTSDARKPCFSTRIEYTPRIRVVKSKLPVWSVSVVLVPTGPISMILAPGTTAPVLSRTTPATPPLTVDSWAKLGSVKPSIKATTAIPQMHFLAINSLVSLIRLAAPGTKTQNYPRRKANRPRDVHAGGRKLIICKSATYGCL